MSKGEIVEHIGEGRYRIKLKYAVEQLQQELSKINARLAELAVDVPSHKLLVLQKDMEAKDIESQIDALIPDYRAGIDGALEQIRELQTQLVTIRGEYAILVFQRDQLISENLSLLKRRGQIERIPEDKDMKAWCADYTTDLSGEVGILDVNDEGGKGVVIHPGYSEEAAWQAIRDGVLMPRQAQSGAQLYFNAAVMPGVQKWRPRYRLGTISNIAADSCRVVLDPAKSSEQQLDINQNQTLNDVPIQYMDCNGDAFEDGDTVLVRFTDTGPVVVGFYENPRECTIGDFAFMPVQYDSGLTTFGLPEIVGDPLGTPDGTNPAWFMKRDPAEPWEIKKYRPAEYGCQDWQGPNGLVLSWHAAPGRCYVSWFRTLAVGNFFNRSTVVFCNGSQVADIDTVVSGCLVYGAAVYDGKLIVIGRSSSVWNVIEYPWQGKATAGPGALVDSFTLDPDYVPNTGWYFNRSGNVAVITLNSGREKVASQKYTVGSGAAALTVLWERDYEATGTLTSTSLGGLETHDVYSKDQNQHQIPMYVDFIGDQETTLYLRHRPYSLLADLHTVNEEFSESEHQAGVDLILSTGEVLASIGPNFNREWYLNNTSSDGVGSPDTMFFQVTDNTRTFSEDNLFIDIRQKAVMVEVLESESSALFSGQPDGSGFVSGSEATSTRTVFEMHVGGSLLFSKEMQEVSSSASQMQFETVPDSLAGEQGAILGPLGPSMSNNQHLVNVGYYEAKGQSIATLFIRYPDSYGVGGVEESAFENLISGYADVDLQLFDGRQDMTLYGLGRV